MTLLYSSTRAIPAHNLHMDFVTAWADTGSSIVFPPVAYKENGIFTLTEYDRFLANPHSVHFVFHIKWVDATVTNKHVVMDFEHYSLAKGGARFNNWGSPYFCNYLIYSGWRDRQGWPPPTVAVPGGSTTYNGNTYEQFATTYPNVPVVGLQPRINYQRQDVSMSVCGGYDLGLGPPDPNPPLGMTWVHKQHYFFEFTIAYIDFYTAGATAVFQIHNLRYADPAGIDPEVTILPTPNGW